MEISVLKPMGNRIVVKQDDLEEKVGSLYVSEAHKDKPTTGVVLAVGVGEWDTTKQDYIPTHAKVGDKVAYAKYGGTPFHDKELGDVIILNDADVLVVIKPKED